jgi:hypothetical protein
VTTAQKLARIGATFALALAMVVATAPSFAFASDDEDNNDPSAAPFVLNTVDGSIQEAAGATEFGLGTGAAASGEDGLGTAVQGTQVGSAVTDLGIGIPAGALGRP